MDKLNRHQLAAAAPHCGVSLVIAGAGTGKTSTMISKIINVITHGVVKPHEIVILTFSRKAADEISERLKTALDKNTSAGFSGTFHSFALMLLKYNDRRYLAHRGMNSFPGVITSEEREHVMKKLVMENRENFLGLPADVVMKLSGSINHLDKKTISKLKTGTLYEELISIKNKFENYKREMMLLEFEDMIDHAADLLTSYDDIRENLYRKYRYIFVDEFQDTSENNFRLLSLLLPEKDKNIFMVGDDYQSIYRFRHSRVEYIINIKKFFPDVTVHKLTVNYRSKREIISLSNRFIKLNRFRTSKKIISQKGKGGCVKFHQASDMHDETGIILKIMSSSPVERRVAVLYRNNYQGEFLKKKISDRGIPDRVCFMTMHASKGLEFDIVIIAGISDKIIPDHYTDIEEERRLFYVALTRAENELHLIYHLNRPDETPRFIRELGFTV